MACLFSLTEAEIVSPFKEMEPGLSLTLVYLVHKHVKISVDEWILETTRPQKHVKFLEKVQRGTALSVINAIKWSAETVMEFNTFL